MGLSKQEESAIIDIYTTYFDNYVKGDVEGLAGLLEDGYTQIGSAESEVFFNKQEALQFIYDTIDQVKGKADFRNRSIKCKQIKDYILVIDLWDMFVLDDKDWAFYSKFRASTLMEKLVTNGNSFTSILPCLISVFRRVKILQLKKSLKKTLNSAMR
jgi:hypothetical protein